MVHSFPDLRITWIWIEELYMRYNKSKEAASLKGTKGAWQMTSKKMSMEK